MILGVGGSDDRVREVDVRRMVALIWPLNFLLGYAGVAKLVYAPGSKSGEVHSSCRFESDLRHQKLSDSVGYPFFTGTGSGLAGFFGKTQEGFFQGYSLRRELHDAEAVLDQQGIDQWNLLVGHLQIERLVPVLTKRDPRVL